MTGQQNVRLTRSVLMGPSSRLRLAGTTLIYRDKFSSSKFSAVDANSCMLASRSELPVYSVIAAD